jgi:hypothetical protein
MAACAAPGPTPVLVTRPLPPPRRSEPDAPRTSLTGPLTGPLPPLTTPGEPTPPPAPPAPHTPIAPPAPPRPTAPPASPARDPRDPYACDGPGQCVLVCPEVQGCCGAPCGCRHAIHRDHAEAFAARYADTCDRAPCPAVGSAWEPAHGAACVSGRCTATDGLAF